MSMQRTKRRSELSRSSNFESSSVKRVSDSKSFLVEANECLLLGHLDEFSPATTSMFAFTPLMTYSSTSATACIVSVSSSVKTMTAILATTLCHRVLYC